MRAGTLSVSSAPTCTAAHLMCSQTHTVTFALPGRCTLGTLSRLAERPGAARRRGRVNASHIIRNRESNSSRDSARNKETRRQNKHQRRGLGASERASKVNCLLTR